MSISEQNYQSYSLEEAYLSIDGTLLFPSPDIGKVIFNLPSLKMKKRKADITLDELKKGSEEVLKRIYKENRNKFINFARQYNLSNDDIIDIYHDAYIIFYNNVMNNKLQTLTSSISTYLISIGKYLILAKMKKNNQTTNLGFDEPTTKKEIQRIKDIAINELTVEQKLLYKHFANLGKPCQELLTSFYHRGFTIKDILDQGHYNSENVIKSAKSRCMKNLKKRIKANRLLNE